MPSRGRVLIVDDEPQVAAMLEAVVTALGYTARIAGTGPAALSLLPGFQPDVVLLDLGLPDMPGDVVLEQLRRTDPSLPVIMITGNNDDELARHTLTRGAFDYLGKPFKLERLGKVLEAALAHRR